eukprot:gene9724-11940_t
MAVEKPLYMAHSVEELVREHVETIEVDKAYKIFHYLCTCNNLIKQASVYKNEGDFERAYVYYLRFCILAMEKLPKHPEYNDVKFSKFRDSLRNDAVSKIEELEIMRENLNGRYRTIKLEKESEEKKNFEKKQRLLNEQRLREEQQRLKEEEDRIAQQEQRELDMLDEEIKKIQLQNEEAIDFQKRKTNTERKLRMNMFQQQADLLRLEAAREAKLEQQRLRKQQESEELELQKQRQLEQLEIDRLNREKELELKKQEDNSNNINSDNNNSGSSFENGDEFVYTKTVDITSDDNTTVVEPITTPSTSNLNNVDFDSDELLQYLAKDKSQNSTQSTSSSSTTADNSYLVDPTFAAPPPTPLTDTIKPTPTIALLPSYQNTNTNTNSTSNNNNQSVYGYPTIHQPTATTTYQSTISSPNQTTLYNNQQQHQFNTSPQTLNNNNYYKQPATIQTSSPIQHNGITANYVTRNSNGSYGQANHVSPPYIQHPPHFKLPPQQQQPPFVYKNPSIAPPQPQQQYPNISYPTTTKSQSFLSLAQQQTTTASPPIAANKISAQGTPHQQTTPTTTPSKPKTNIDSPEASKKYSRLRKVIVNGEIFSEFMRHADYNTRNQIETCGILSGTLSNDVFKVTTLIIPKQEGTSDTCNTVDEHELVEYQLENDLLTLGWIHTHPTQDCFLSAVDVHTHCSYQYLLQEAIAVVISPMANPNFGIFRLTDPPGLETVQKCKLKSFHPHPPVNGIPIYTKVDHVDLIWGRKNELPNEFFGLFTPKSTTTTTTAIIQNVDTNNSLSHDSTTSSTSPTSASNSTSNSPSIIIIESNNTCKIVLESLRSFTILISKQLNRDYRHMWEQFEQMFKSISVHSKLEKFKLKSDDMSPLFLFNVKSLAELIRNDNPIRLATQSNSKQLNLVRFVLNVKKLSISTQYDEKLGTVLSELLELSSQSLKSVNLHPFHLNQRVLDSLSNANQLTTLKFCLPTDLTKWKFNGDFNHLRTLNISKFSAMDSLIHLLGSKQLFQQSSDT